MSAFSVDKLARTQLTSRPLELPLCVLLPSSLLAACGDIPESGLAPAEEMLGTQDR
jgi:hypothetical protein